MVVVASEMGHGIISIMVRENQGIIPNVVREFCL